MASEPFVLRDSKGGDCETKAAVIPSDATHALTADGQRGWLLYLQHVRGGHSDDAATWAADASGVPLPSVHGHLDAWARNVSNRLRTVRDDQSGFVLAAMTAARSVLPEPVRLAEIAERVGVAPTTLSRRFTQVVGVPWRRWILTERLLMAAGALAGGANLTAAAHRSGFADSAHLTRTFRRMFGIAPSDLTAVATWHLH